MDPMNFSSEKTKNHWKKPCPWRLRSAISKIYTIYCIFTCIWGHFWRVRTCKKNLMFWGKGGSSFQTLQFFGVLFFFGCMNFTFRGQKRELFWNAVICWFCWRILFPNRTTWNSRDFVNSQIVVEVEPKSQKTIVNGVFHPRCNCEILLTMHA